MWHLVQAPAAAHCLLPYTLTPGMVLNPWQTREDFTREEAEAFVAEAVALAMARAASSGGCTRLVTVDKDGAHHTYIDGGQVRSKGGTGLGIR